MIKLDEKFISWYDKKIEEGYKPYLNINEIENLVNKIVIFYKETEDYKGNLIGALTEKESILLKEGYRSNSYTEDKELSYTISEIGKDDSHNHKVYVDPESEEGLITGGFNHEKLLDNHSKFYDKEIKTIKDLFTLLNLEFRDTLNYSEIKNAMRNNVIDAELRNKIFDIVYKNLLKENGYTADAFVDDITTYLNKDNKSKQK